MNKNWIAEDSLSCGSPGDRYLEDEDSAPACFSVPKGICSRKLRHHSKDFSWLGSPTCRRRRNHYHSFCRNGITISVHDFVYVMGEDNKRLVAYVEDMYEDFKLGNMVSVRWFHKVDEVCISLPSDTDDREVFFTLCYQELSIECIDGLVAVLSSKHFEKYLNEAANITWESYLCRREIDNDDDIKPFDITQVPGYWNQEFLRYMYTASTDSHLKLTSSGSDLDETGNRTRRPKRKNGLGFFSEDATLTCRNKARHLTVNSEVVKDGQASCLPGKEAFKQKFQQQLSAGYQVEVLSQDSGMRGCWFRCIILKRHKDKIKVRYKDVQDAEGLGNLEEWLFASKVAVSDKLGIRLRGRTVIRPHPSPGSKTNSCFNVGSVVDVWWHEGWWEGIVIHRESDHKIRVYFPGEDRTAFFDQGELRHSLEYMQNKWNQIKDRPDLVSLLLTNQELEKDSKGSQGHMLSQTSPLHTSHSSSPAIGCKFSQVKSICGKLDPWDSDEEKKKEVEEFAQAPLCDLKWGSYRKRSRSATGKSSISFKKQCSDCSDSSNDQNDDEDPSVCFQFPLTKPFTTDPENCKVGGDILFNPPLSMSNLVMTR